MDTSTCAAAINPSHFSGHGADEYDRYLSGAASRGEPALIIATMGTADDDDDRVRSVFGRPGGRVDFRHFTGAIVGKRLLAGAEVSLVPDLDAADRDLGLRLLNRPPSAPWWAMTVQASAFEGPRGTTAREPEGELVPILVDSLGEPVVARWTSGDGQQIWYVIPDGVDWNQVVDWLVQRALPEHVPAALRRVRSRNRVDPALETPAETQARSSLEELERRYLEDKARLEEELERARQEAEPMRNGLLYGSGSELEDAVAVVLRAAGFAVTDLDEELGGTLSADLLAVLNGSTCLVEVKAAVRAASTRCCAVERRIAHTRASRTASHGGSGTANWPGSAGRPASAYQAITVQRTSRPARACRPSTAATATVSSASTETEPRPSHTRACLGNSPSPRHRSSCAADTTTSSAARRPISSTSAGLGSPLATHPNLEPREVPGNRPPRTR